MPDAHDGAVVCEGCSRKYRWQAKFAGKKVRCQCGHKLVMPDTQPGQDDDIIPLAIDEADLNPPASRARPTPPAAPAAQEPALPVSAFALATGQAASAPGNCPSCQKPVNPSAVICLECGYNLKENKQLTTQTGGRVRASTGPVSGPRRSYANQGQDGFFTRLSRSWELIKTSYGIIWDFKQLIVFPIFSAIAAILVTASLIYPAISVIGAINAVSVEHGTGELSPIMQQVAYAALGLVFYFCNYFVIVFFNTALTACAMKVTAGEVPTLQYGLSIAIKRLPQIAAWALVSALVGQLIKVLESQKIIGRILAVVLGSGWAIITYFVVPVLCVEGVGPFKAVKQSFVTIKDTWGESLLGNTAVGVINFLLSLPFIVLIAVSVMLLISDQQPLGLALLAVSVLGLLIFMAASSAADGVFRALLYNYATGRSLPADVDEDLFGAVFASKPYDD